MSEQAKIPKVFPRVGESSVDNPVITIPHQELLRHFSDAHVAGTDTTNGDLVKKWALSEAKSLGWTTASFVGSTLILSSEPLPKPEKTKTSVKNSSGCTNKLSFEDLVKRRF